MPRLDYTWPDQMLRLPFDHTEVTGPPVRLEAAHETLMRVGTPAANETDPNGLDAHAPGAKLDAGKCKAAVLGDFSRALRQVADVGSYGAVKYTRGGWQRVMDGPQRYSDALWRHLLAAQQENLDPDTGMRHLAHACWNLLAVLELEARHGE